MIEDIRKIRIILRHKNKNRALCKVAFSKSDSSIYIFPYGKTGRYFYGEQKIEEQMMSNKFSYVEQFSSENIPKLSFHQSGKVHVYYNRESIAGPIKTLPVTDWKGGHIATVTTDGLESAIEYKKELKRSGKERDIQVSCNPSLESIRLSIYCNESVQKFADETKFSIKIKRPCLKNPIYFGFAFFPQINLGRNANENEKSKGGITALAGWKPNTGKNKMKFVFLRAQ